MFNKTLLSVVAMAIFAFSGCMDDGPPVEGETTDDPVAGTQFDVTASEYQFSPETLSIPAGQQVTVTLQNDGELPHDWGGGFGSAGDVRTDTIDAGESGSVTFTVAEPGEFDFWCSVPGHRSLGMEGTLVVE